MMYLLPKIKTFNQFMQNGKSYIRDSGHFIDRIKNISNLTENARLVTTDVVGLYPSIPHQAGSSALKEALANRSLKKIPKMAAFVLKNSFSVFNNKVFQQISGTVLWVQSSPLFKHAFT